MDVEDPASVVRRSVQRLARRLRQERPPDGLSSTKLSLLAQLMDYGPQTSGELARRGRTTPQALTRSIEALVDGECVRRVTNSADKRQQLLTITETGLEALGKDAAPRDAFLGRAMAELLTPAERQLLAVAAGLMVRLAEYTPTADR
ncbi:MarR family winged helix-turn-helix transcriptional regulator [Pseudonocardia acaciae]|uniref:MarR family winged helix-turn-helix transcriptional regulator n=1 Tax=Pseudonocardia acaciae TaxID=551276 RepID=UPI00048E395C|nr:MarR family transcriptional regulator [Pseudonocardia acaciae]